MPIYHQLGDIPPKRHIALRKEFGGVFQEQLVGNFGFSGPASLLYHIYPPTRVKKVGYSRVIDFQSDPDPTLRLRHFRTGALPGGGSPTLDRIPLLFNRDVAILFSSPTQQDQHFFRNAMGDELLFIAEGTGVLQTQFGQLDYGPGDQLIIPRGIMYRLQLGSGVHKILVVETRGFLRTPKRYRNEFGQLVEGAPLSERDIRRPANLETVDERGDFRIVVKQHHVLNEVILDHHPFDVVGWDGYYYPWVFNIRDFESIVGRIHQPPPVHQLFECEGLVVCNFCPRPFDFHPEAIPAPYAHSNVMSDEVLFYFSKEFMSRKTIEFGSITLHPDGLPHGPHPGRYEESMGKAGSEEFALMIDTFHPLHVAKDALKIEDQSYQFSWLEEG